MLSATVRIAVVMGGISAERDVSKMTGACVTAALSGGSKVKPVEIRDDGSWEVPGGFVGDGLSAEPDSWFAGGALPLLEALARLQEEEIDVVFNALHGPWGEDGSFQGLLRYAGIPFTGPDVIAAAVTMEKCLTKEALRGARIETPRFFVLPRARDVDWERLGADQLARVRLPWIAKPRRLGSSVGVEIFHDVRAFVEWAESRVREEDCVAKEIDEALFIDDYFVEELISGRELTCGALETEGVLRVLPPIEIRPRTSDFFDYEAKYTPGATDEICPAPLSAEESEAVRNLAARVHALFRCEPLSRTDIFLTADGRLTVLEVNTLPGLTATSLIPLSASRAGISLEQLASSLVGHALSRARRWAVVPQR